MIGAIWVLALVVGAGLAGSFFVARRLSGWRAVFVWISWLMSPFALIALLLAVESYPTLPHDRASYNFAFGFVLLSIIVAIPWFPANLIGGLVGWRFRKAGKAPLAGDAARDYGDAPDGQSRI